jgi:hypothetical protein
MMANRGKKISPATSVIANERKLKYPEEITLVQAGLLVE